MPSDVIRRDAMGCWMCCGRNAALLKKMDEAVRVGLIQWDTLQFLLTECNMARFISCPAGQDNQRPLYRSYL